MNLKSILTFLSLLIIGVLTSPVSARAINIPDFPKCTSPQGQVKVSYDSGIHGIPGDAGQYQGSDVVYTVSDSQLAQCFCAANKSGIQTNWWKVGSLNSEQLNYLKNLGWIYIPDGSAWGLDPVAYMAQNSQYACGEVTPTPTGHPQPCNGCHGPPTAPVCTSQKPPAPSIVSIVRGSTTAQITWTSVTPATNYAIFYGVEPGNYIYGVPNTGNVTSYVIGSLVPGVQYYFQVRAVNGCMPSDGSGTNGQVLGLATTGNMGEIVSLLAVFLALVASALLSRRSNRRAA